MKDAAAKYSVSIKHKHRYALLMILLFVLLHIFLAASPFISSSYNSYTLQALAWRDGKMCLPDDVPHLELAVFDGHYYVSFPPVPSIPLFLLSFFFGENIPDGILVKLYILIAFYALTHMLMLTGWHENQASSCSFLLCTASSMLPMLLDGAVWYQAQVMAFMFTTLAIQSMLKERRTLSLTFFALSVGCRPFNALYGFLLLYIYLSEQKPLSTVGLKHRLKPILPGILAGLCIACAYGWYNMARFGAPFEFGHNYLPEFSFQGGQQFSIRHIPANIANFVFGLPFEQSYEGPLSLKQFGFSLFLANPVLLLLAFCFVADIILSRLNALKATVALLFVLHLLLLLTHRTFGGFQFGSRYAVDLIPYAAVYLTQQNMTQSRRRACMAIMSAGLVFSIYGSLMIRLP